MFWSGIEICYSNLLYTCSFHSTHTILYFSYLTITGTHNTFTIHYKYLYISITLMDRNLLIISMCYCYGIPINLYFLDLLFCSRVHYQHHQLSKWQTLIPVIVLFYAFLSCIHSSYMSLFLHIFSVVYLWTFIIFCSFEN